MTICTDDLSHFPGPIRSWAAIISFHFFTFYRVLICLYRSGRIVYEAMWGFAGFSMEISPKRAGYDFSRKKDENYPIFPCASSHWGISSTPVLIHSTSVWNRDGNRDWEASLDLSRLIDRKRPEAIRRTSTRENATINRTERGLSRIRIIRKSWKNEVNLRTWASGTSESRYYSKPVSPG